MAEEKKPGSVREMVSAFRTSGHWAVSLARDLLWVIAVVGGIALCLYLICGTWPAIVTIESESMVPHMNVGDLVIVVEEDRFGALMAWDTSQATGYKKFGDYGDVIIYRPNGVQDFWSSVGLLPLSRQHPIIHRAMTWVDEGQPEPAYINTGRGNLTPAEYVPLHESTVTIDGYTVLYTGATPPAENITTSGSDLIMRTPSGKYILPSAYIVPGAGYIRYTSNAPHGGYITKGDNNIASDQGYLTVSGATIEPVKKEWVVGKSFLVVPLIGLLPLHITEVIIVVVILMIAYEWYSRRREAEPAGTVKKTGKKKKK